MPMPYPAGEIWTSTQNANKWIPKKNNIIS